MSQALGRLRRRAWTPTPAFVRALTCSALGLVTAVIFREPAAVVLVAPLMIGMVLGLLRRPTGTPRVSLQADASSLLEGQATTFVARVSADEDIDVVAVELTSVRWLEGVGGRPARSVPLAPGEEHDIELVVRTLRWGRRQIGPAVAYATAAYGLLRRGPFLSELVSSTTLPLREGFEATDVVPRAEGMVGPHRSRRVGEGTDIAGVRPFQLGDRLHRINWAVSLRTGDLHVTSTLSDRDTEVVIVIDTHYDVGQSDGIEGSSSSLDTTVRAAASIAEHYLRHGDRVGLIDLGQAIRRVRSGSGRAHLIQLLDVLVDAKPSRAATGSGITATLALSQLRPGTLVLLLSPLIGEHILTRAASLARSGYPVLIVDTLPDDAAPERRSEWTGLAWRLWLLERGLDIGRLAELSVPVVVWQGTGSLDEVLRDVSRAAAAPKALR